MTELLGTFSVRFLARRSFLRGAASAFDITGNTRRQYRSARSGADADFRALRADWRAVGGDMRGALDAAAKERLAQ
jgi:hypothetical protein